MNDTTRYPSAASGGAWRGSDDRLPVPDASALAATGNVLPAAEEALHAKADQLRETRDAWAENVRDSVRRNPLVSVAAALTLGALVARITR